MKVKGSLITQLVKNPRVMKETPVRYLGREDSLEKGKAIQYSGLQNSMDCIVHAVAKSRTRLNNSTTDHIWITHKSMIWLKLKVENNL